MFDRMMRHQREREDARRTDRNDLVECSSCKKLFPYNQLLNESTQEYFYATCERCYAKRLDAMVALHEFGPRDFPGDPSKCRYCSLTVSQGPHYVWPFEGE